MPYSHRVLSTATVFLAAFAAANALAQPPGAPSGRHGDKPHGADRAAAKAARAGASDAGASDAGASEETGEHGRGPMMGGHRHERGGFRALGEDFRQGRVKKAELKERLAAMHDSAKERRHEHQRMLESRWGATLANPACREELRHHARREAFLGRALFIAETEVKKDQEKVIERIKKLMEKEDERHARAMERLKATADGGAPPPTASGASSAPSPAAPTPAVTASAAQEGGT